MVAMTTKDEMKQKQQYSQILQVKLVGQMK